MTDHIVTNCLGTFVIENRKIKHKTLFRQITDFENKKIIEQNEKQLLAKSPHAQLQKQYIFPETREYFQKFYEANMAHAKTACREAVKKEHLVIQAVLAVQEIEKATHPLVKRLRLWFSLSCPEIPEKIENNEKLIQLIATKKRQELLKEFSIEDSVGAELSHADLAHIENYAKQLQTFYNYKKTLEEYIEKTMQDIAPNCTAVAGAQLAAELLAHAGSLEKLALMPASTVQLLGAENALFGYLRKQGRCPRHGIIVKHPLLASAKEAMHGKIARRIAGAISRAVKIDYFKGDIYEGYKIVEKLEKQVKMLHVKK